MIICSTSNIDLIHGQDIEGYGITDGKTDWRITNIPSITPGQTGIFSIFNSVTPTIPNISILETGTVGIGTIPSISSTSKMEILGSVNIDGSYMTVSNNATSTTVLSISNNCTPTLGTPSIELIRGITGDNNMKYKIGNYNGDFKVMSSIYNTDNESFVINSSANVGIGTTNPLKKLHLFDNSTNNTSLVIQNNSITVTGTSSPVINPTNVSGGTFSIGQITESIDRFMIFTAGTSSFTVPTGGLNCDILMIGSGGSSGNGGSGAGACIVAVNQTFPEGLCTVVVGASVGGSTQVNGQDSSISVAGTIRYLAKGGGFVSGIANTKGGDGGCGGGASPWSTGNGTAASGGIAVGTNIVNAIPNIGVSITSTYAVLGNAGGGNGGISGAAGGGGGIEPNVSSGAGSSASSTAAGKGGDGAYQVTLNTSPPRTLNFRSYFANNLTFGVENGTTGNYYIGGGGGGLGSGGSQGNGGLGGGGGVNRAGVANTGSGGSTGGASGSGIVIVRYRVNETALGNPSMELIRGTSGDTNTDYKIGNYGGELKVMSSISNTDTDRLSISSSGNLTLSNNTNINTVMSIQNSFNTAGGSFVAEFTGVGNTAPSIHDQVTASTDRYMIFKNDSANHTFTVPSGGINCDILMIGGGGGGYNGGGGAGACIIAINQTLPAGSCIVKVGSKGTYAGSNGGDSFITVGGSDIYRAKGGGACLTNSNTPGNAGGCGGGANSNSDTTTESGGVAVSTNVVNGVSGIGPGITSTYAVLGNAGGNNGTAIGGRGSGGGIGVAGVSGVSGCNGGDGAYQVTLTTSPTTTTINFRNWFANGDTTFGVKNGATTDYYIGGGGGVGSGFIGGLGGGGGGNNGTLAIANTGGGGGSYDQSGASGIIIIRYRIATTTPGTPSIELIRGTSGDTNTDYKIGNYGGDFKVMSSISNTDTERIIINSTGNVGIGTNAPNNILQVGNSSRLRISNGSSDYTRIGTNDLLGTTNTRINIFGNTSASTPGQIDYYATSTGPHVFYTTDSNTEMMRITSTGNVGIGTTNPTSKLHVNGTINGTFSGNGASITSLNAGNISDGTLAVARGGTGRTSFTGNQILVGSLSQSGDLTWDGNTFYANGNSGTKFVLRGSSPTIYLRDTDNRTGMIHMNGNLMHFLNGSGSDSETWATQNGQSWALTLDMNNNNAVFGGNVSANYYSGNGGGLTSLNMDNVNNGTLAIARGGTARTWFAANEILVGSLTQSGNLTWDGSSLYVNGYVNCTTYLRPSAGNGNNGIIFPADPGGGSGDVAFIKYYARSGEGCTLEIASTNDADDHILLSTTGGVGIGVIPASKLHVSGDILATGNITAYYSDERLKTKIGDIKDPLEIINKLNGFYYTPNDLARKNGITNTGIEIGLSAQEVQKVLPEIVRIAPFDSERNKDGVIVSKSGENYLTMSYERLVPVFVEAIKELERKNIELSREIALIKEGLK